MCCMTSGILHCNIVCRHLDTNGDGMLSRQEVQNMIAKLAPGGGGDAAAAQEVMDSIADSRTGSIDFGGFLHFFSMVMRLIRIHTAHPHSYSIPQVSDADKTILVASLSGIDSPKQE